MFTARRLPDTAGRPGCRKATGRVPCHYSLYNINYYTSKSLLADRSNENWLFTTRRLPDIAGRPGCRKAAGKLPCHRSLYNIIIIQVSLFLLITPMETPVVLCMNQVVVYCKSSGLPESLRSLHRPELMPELVVNSQMKTEAVEVVVDDVELHVLGCRLTY